MKARNDENLEGIQGLARELGRLLPRGGARGEAIAELQARAKAAERELEDDRACHDADRYRMEQAEATLAAVWEWREKWAASQLTFEAADELDAILDGKGEK